MEREDFGPKTPPPWLLAIGLVLYGPMFGAVTFFVARDQLRGAPNAGDWAFVVLMAVVYVAVLPLGLVFVLYEAKRFRFDDAGVAIRNVVGRRRIEWRDVTRATLVRAGSDVGRFADLRVETACAVAKIPLTAFRRPASLLRAIRRRVPVEIGQDAGVDATAIRDEDLAPRSPPQT